MEKKNTIAFEIIQGSEERAFGAKVIEVEGDIANTHAGLITVAMAAITVVAMSSKRPVNDILMDMIEMSPDISIGDVQVMEKQEGEQAWSSQ